MGTKSVRLDEDLYERIEAHKRADETFSEAIERLIGGYSLLDFAGGLSEDEDGRLRESIEEANETYDESLGAELDPGLWTPRFSSHFGRTTRNPVN